jgi:NAD(P)H dehydrogenase (quinone)
MQVMMSYYSLDGHVHKMAQSVAQGVALVAGAEAGLRRVPETLAGDVIEKMGAAATLALQQEVPVCTVEELAEADAVIFGTPTRFGNMCGQMKQFLDATGSLWQKGALVGKAAGVFTSSNTQHGGQESTILSFHIVLLHQGMVVVGLPYAFPGLMETGEMSGGSPYGASTIAGNDGSRTPSDNELNGARYQGEHIARIAAKLVA